MRGSVAVAFVAGWHARERGRTAMRLHRLLSGSAGWVSQFSERDAGRDRIAGQSSHTHFERLFARYQTMPTPTQVPPHGRPPYGQPRPRRKLVTGIAAGAAAAVVVAGFLAALALRGSGPSVAATPVPRHTATTAARPTATTSATPGTTTTPAPSTFVCANPTGSQMVYAYVRGDGNLYVVQGCSTPRQVAVGMPYPQPLAWSPSNSYLMVDTQLPNGEENIIAVNAVTGQHYPTGFTRDYTPNLAPGDTAHIFIGWLDDKTLLGVNVPITSTNASGDPIGPMTLVEVDLFGGKQHIITKIMWAASFAVRDNSRYVFYSGYQSTSEGGAYLHRVDLVTGMDTKLVPLGIAGHGPCQGTPICPWAAPWDVTADGVHVVYHNPGPSSTPSDTNFPKDSPLFYANVNGSGATRPFGSKLASGLTTPVISPDGRYMVAAGGNFTPDPFGPPQTGIAQLSGGYNIVNGSFQTWRGDSQAMVLLSSSNGSSSSMLYALANDTTYPLEANAQGYTYVWGN
jgi:hypothetical protein